MDNQQFIDKIEELRHNTYSRITNIQKEENGLIFIEFHYDRPTFLLLLSGKSMSEEFPDMKPLDAIIKMN